MKKALFFLFFVSLFTLIISAEEEIIITGELYTGRDIEIKVDTGEEYLHKFIAISFLPFVGPNTPPQIAFWLEDMEGKYLETIYVCSYKIKKYHY